MPPHSKSDQTVQHSSSCASKRLGGWSQTLFDLASANIPCWPHQRMKSEIATVRHFYSRHQDPSSYNNPYPTHPAPAPGEMQHVFPTWEANPGDWQASGTMTWWRSATALSLGWWPSPAAAPQSTPGPLSYIISGVAGCLYCIGSEVTILELTLDPSPRT